MLAYSQSRLVGGLCLGDKHAKPGFSHKQLNVLVQTAGLCRFK